ncbi:hypothetical protein [Psittacicella hinzii]|nr:hypothetical protein [Psittacicella hinzii]
MCEKKPLTQTTADTLHITVKLYKHQESDKILFFALMQKLPIYPTMRT